MLSKVTACFLNWLFSVATRMQDIRTNTKCPYALQYNVSSYTVFTADQRALALV